MTKQGDPNKEPSGGEVEDWHGQEVARQEEQAEQALQEAGGDEAEAEKRFEESSDQ
jgi:hypothetical protein